MDIIITTSAKTAIFKASQLKNTLYHTNSTKEILKEIKYQKRGKEKCKLI